MSALLQTELPELVSERLDRVRRETEEILKVWDERLRLPFSNLGERYLGNHLCVHLHFRLPRWAENPETSACAIFHCSDWLEGLSHSKGRRLRCNVDQFPVFVELVENVNLQERRPMPVGSMVWLQTLDACQRRDARDSLYLSTKSGMFNFAIEFSQDTFRRRFADGELDFVSGPTSAFLGGDLPDDVVKGGSQVMNYLSGQDAQSRDCGSLKNMLADFLKGFSILIRKDYVIPFQIPSHGGHCGYEGGDFGIEVTDVLVGPF